MSEFVCETCKQEFKQKSSYTRHLNKKIPCKPVIAKFYDNQSPLRYPGGKTRACKILDEIINKYFDMSKFDTIISPFMGGGSFEFYLQNKYGKKLIVNDKFTPLTNFWTQVKIDKKVLCEELRKIDKVSKEDFETFRKEIMGLNEDILKQAIYYFVINRCSFSGATLSGGFSSEASKKRFTSSSIDRIEVLDFSNIEVLNMDFSDFIPRNFTDTSFMFLDPPYYLGNNSKLYGDSGDLHENFDHQKLYDIISKHKNWLLTYNDCKYIRELYKDFTILEVSWSYGMNKSKDSSEIVILNQ